MGLRVASLFMLWLALCYANEIKKGRTRNHGHYVCSTWGNNHFKTFDGDIYQFPGICEYNFASDCRESYKEFSVHIQRALNNNNHPEIQYILITIKDFTVFLRPRLAVVDGRIVKTPYYSSGVLIESNDIYTKVYAKLGLILIWNQEDALMVELDSKFNNYTCGLCGDYNGVPIYNEFINGVTSYNSITYGNLQKISKPNAKCEDPDETQAIPSCNGHRDECERLLTSSAFADCRLRLNLEMYIQACMQDKCACNGNEDSFCLCSTISEYSRQCSHAGGRPGEWRTQYFCPKTCPDTMIYRESSSPCMDTCSHLEISSLCEEHYTDGCFCPEGTVYDDITEKGCIPASQCHCKLHEKEYSPGESITNECEECTCDSGRWTCKDLPCPGTCSVEGGSHITTFDGKKYTFHGDCYYVLAKGTVNDSHALLAELAPCGSTARQTCLKTVVLLVDHKKNVVVFRSDGSVLLNEMTVNVPHVSASFSVLKQSSNYLVVQTSSGLQLQIQLFPVMQLFATVDQSVQGKLQGLCGNFNGMEGDDFKTTSGLVEATGSAFANTWKAQSTCKDQVEKLEDPCSLSIESANYAEHWCSLLKNSEGPFARCHLIIDPSEYYKKCKYDTCLCEDNEECLCAALSSYSRACAFKGIILGGWRKSVCTSEVSACPGNQIFLYNLTICQQTCRSLADGEKHCLQDFAPVDGCGCPYNTYLDNQDTCVPISECPCYYKGSYLEPGKYVTKDGERCVCRNAKVECTSVTIRMKSATECSSNKTYFDCNASPKWTFQTPVQLSCHTPQTDHFQSECVSGCVCPEGLFDDGKGGCVEEKDCPCIHNNQWYSPGQKITVDCNTCTCQKRVWNCTEDVCYGTCMIYGSGHYVTFDGKFYDFDGSCEYVATQDFCGDKNSSGSFSIITENVPCGTTGVTCSKAIKIFLGKTELKLENKDYKEIQRDIGDDVHYWNRTVGLYLVIEASNGVMLIWDKKTTVFIKLTPDYKGKVCGLCGNFDDKSNNDFTTRSGLQETNALKFGNSWKQSPMCPDVTQEIKPCDVKPHRKSWAEKECSIIRSDVFKICHSKVDPIPFFEACVHDACSCDSGGDCECFCSAVAAYAQECTKAQACVFWRTPDICPIFCDYYNPRNECDWHYEPCGSNIMTCRMINNVSTNFSVPYLEGCYPRCPKDKPVYNEETKECVPEDQCWCYINGTNVPPGNEIPTEENCTKCVCGPSGSIQCTPIPGCPCVINGTSYEVGETVAQIQDGNICITYVCAANGSIVVGSIYPCPTSISPTTISTLSPTSTLTATVTITRPPVTTTPCFGLICNWTEWFDVSKPEEGGGDYETYEAIRNEHGNKICKAPEEIECRAKDKPDVSLEELGQKVECNVTYGLICKNEEQDPTMWQLCYNYEIRVNCCEWHDISCDTTSTLSPTPTATSTTTSTTVPITTTTRQPTAITTTPTPTPTITSEFTPSVTTPVTPSSPECECIWTDWIDVSYPNSSDRNSGDYETFENIWKNNSSWVCVKAENISCRAKRYPDVPIADLGQNVECNVETGLICNNRDQSIGGIIPMPVCLNYEISVCCIPNIPACITSTTTSTTTAPPSSTMSTVSPPPVLTTAPTPTSSEPPSSTATTTMPPSSTTSSTPWTTTTVPGTSASTPTTASAFPTPTIITKTSEPPASELIKCECIWTDWIDVSYPNSSDRNSGDYETFENIWKNNSSWVCVKAENISCRAKRYPDVPIADLGQNVECNVETGLICNNRDQSIGGIIPMPVCLNYEISVCCIPNIPECITSTTTSTTTAPPSSTMSTVSPPPVLTTAPTPTSSEPPSSTATTTMPPSSTTSSTPWTTTTVPGTSASTPTTASAFPTPTIITKTSEPPASEPIKNTTPESQTPTKMSTTITPSATPLPTTRTTEIESTVSAIGTTIQQSTPPLSTSPPTATTSGVTETGSTTKTTTSGPTPSRPTPHSTTIVTETSSHETTTTGTGSPPTGSPTTTVSTTTSGASSSESTASTTVSPPSVSTSPPTATTSGVTETGSTTKTTTSGPTPSRPTPHSTTIVTETSSHETTTTGTGSPPTGSPTTTVSTTTSGASSPESTASTTVSPPSVSTSPPTATTSGVTETGLTTKTTTSGPTPSRPTPHSTTIVMETSSHETTTTRTGSPPTGSPTTTVSTTTSGSSSSESTASTTVSPPSVSTSPPTATTSGVTETGSTTKTTTSGPTPSRPTPHSTTIVTETSSHETTTTGTGSPPTGSPTTTVSTTTSGASSSESTASTTVSPPSVSTSPPTATTSGVTETGSTTKTTTSGPTPSRPTPHSTTIVTETSSHKTTTTATGSPPTRSPTTTVSTTTSGASSPESTASTTVSPPSVSTSPPTATTSGVTETGSTTKTTTSGPTPSRPTPHSTTIVTETSSHETTTTGTGSPPTGSPTTTVSTTTSGASSPESTDSTTVSPPSVSTSPPTATTSGVTETGLTTKTTTSGPTPSRPTPHSTTIVTETSSHKTTTTATGSPPTRSPTTTVSTTTSGPSSSESTASTTVSPPSVSTSPPTATTSGVTETGSTTKTTTSGPTPSRPTPHSTTIVTETSSHGTTTTGTGSPPTRSPTTTVSTTTSGPSSSESTASTTVSPPSVSTSPPTATTSGITETGSTTKTTTSGPTPSRPTPHSTTIVTETSSHETTTTATGSPPTRSPTTTVSTTTSGASSSESTASTTVSPPSVSTSPPTATTSGVTETGSTTKTTTSGPTPSRPTPHSTTIVTETSSHGTTTTGTGSPPTRSPTTTVSTTTSGPSSSESTDSTTVSPPSVSTSPPTATTSGVTETGSTTKTTTSGPTPSRPTPHSTTIVTETSSHETTTTATGSPPTRSPTTTVSTTTSGASSSESTASTTVSPPSVSTSPPTATTSGVTETGSTTKTTTSGPTPSRPTPHSTTIVTETSSHETTTTGTGSPPTGSPTTTVSTTTSGASSSESTASTTVSPPSVSTSPPTATTSGVTETGSTTKTTTSGPTPSRPTPHSTTIVTETSSHGTTTTGTGSPPTRSPTTTVSTTTSGPSSSESTASTTVSPPSVSTSPPTATTSGVTETGSTTKTTTSGPTPSRPTPHSTTIVTETSSHETTTTGTGSPPTGSPTTTVSTTTSGASSSESTASTTVSPPSVSTSPPTATTSGVTETGSTTKTTTSGPTPSRPTPHSTTIVTETSSHETTTTGTGSPPTRSPTTTVSTTTSGPSSSESTASTTVSPPSVSTSPPTATTSGVTETGSTTKTTTSGPTPSRPTPHSTTIVTETSSHKTTTTGTGSPPTGSPTTTVSTTTSGASSSESTASTTVSPPSVSTSPPTATTSGVTETGLTTKTTTSGPTPSRPTLHGTTIVTETSSHETTTTGTGSPPTGSPTTTVSTTTSGASSSESTASTTVSPPSVSTSPPTATTSGVTETGSTTASGLTPSGPTPHSTTTVTETGSPMTTTATHTTPTRSTAITTTTTSGPSSPESTASTTVSLPSVSTSPMSVSTSGTTPTESFTSTSGTTSSNFTSITATTTTTTSEIFSPGSTSTSGPTATSSAVTIAGSSTYSTVTPLSASGSTTSPLLTTPGRNCSILPNESYAPGESWWLCNCTKAICIEDNIVQVIPIICNPPPKPTCANGLSPVQVIDEDGCCWHWECDCYCTGWGDPHYMTFDGLYYSYQGNCTYVLVEEIYKKVDNFGVYIDNYHCDTRDVVSCPRTLIVRHETQEVRIATVKPNTLQVEVTVNKQAVALPYKKFGLSIYESGINRVVEIPELKMNVTYNGLSFSIRMPYHLFGNNTHGQCGTCNNNTADDCMLPNGNIAENCETMADHWQVVDPSKPQCSPGLIPTKAPSTTPVQPCKESSICELLLGSVFKPCHGFVQPEKYYAACVFDSCVLPNLDLECSSLQIYAATCADQSVCIDWRSHTNGVCSYKCPSDKEYRACGPIKEITCKSSQQNETSAKQVEGCFCPNGTMLYDSGVDVCVKTCGCVGVDKIPREFGEEFTVDCQDCICLEGGNGIVCEPHECAKQNKSSCDGEGLYEVNEVNSEDSCCPIVTCKCNTSLCTTKAPKCTLGFEVHSHIPSGQCCPLYQCVPKRVCVHQNAEFLPNSSVFVDKCQNCFCTNEVNVSTQLNIISCEHIPCNTYCEPGYERQPVKGECCGRCVQTKCVIHTANNSDLILSPGEFKNDPYNNCTIYSCVNIHNQLISSTSEITCPAFNEESCKPGTITFLPNGCCKTCAPVDSPTPCSVRQRKDFIVHKGCRSVDRVVMTECEGTCGTFALYSAEANSMEHSCSCCRESRTTVREVELKCPTGQSISHKYIYVESCSCQDTECSQSSELQNTEENDKASTLNRIKRAINLISK